MAFVLHNQQESKALTLWGVNLYSKMGHRPNEYLTKLQVMCNQCRGWLGNRWMSIL